MRVFAVLMFFCGISAAAEAQTATLLGRIVSQGGRPEAIAGATIRLRGNPEQIVTSDAQGQFAMRNVPAGRVEISVEMIGYASRTEQIVIEPGVTSEVEIVLAREPVKLDPLAVTIRSAWLERTGFFDRRDVGGVAGRFLTSADIERRDPTFLTDMFRDMSGVKVHNAGIGQRIVRFNRTEARGLVDRRRDNLPGCQPLLYLDGRQHIDRIEGGWQTIDDFNIVSPATIAAIEVYVGNAPPEFRSEGCGVILIWTKR